MHLLNIIILTHNSLLSVGLVSKLNEYKEALAVRTLDLSQADYLNILKNESPEIIILDTTESNMSQKAIIIELLETAPEARVISLNLNNDWVKVFSSTEQKVGSASDLVGLLKTFSGADKL